MVNQNYKPQKEKINRRSHRNRLANCSPSEARRAKGDEVGAPRAERIGEKNETKRKQLRFY